MPAEEENTVFLSLFFPFPAEEETYQPSWNQMVKDTKWFE